MKRLCLILAFLFLFTQTASAMPLLICQKVVYRGTVTGLRISAVDGTAFIDNAGATIPTYADGNHQIEIYDDSNRMLRGVLKAAGSSETLGDETFVDVGFADAGSWSVTGTNPTWVITGGKASVTNSSSSATNRILQNVGGNLGTLFKVGGTVDVLSSGAISVTVSGITGDSPNITTTGSFNRYIAKSLVTSSIGFRCSLTGTTAQIDDVSCKQVLAPSASGATIVSAKGGTTYNFNHKNASFTYNAASYYVIIRAIR